MSTPLLLLKENRVLCPGVKNVLQERFEDGIVTQWQWDGLGLRVPTYCGGVLASSS